MYIVIIGSSIPTLVPVFNKRVSKSKSSDTQGRRGTSFNAGDRTILTSTSAPLGRAKTHTSATGRGIGSQIEDDDSAEDMGTENEHAWIAMTGNVKRDEESVGVAQ